MRALVLIGVHLLILGHVAHWVIAARTVSPAVLSDSMHTLERGEINAGVVLFAIAIGVTLVLGRCFCGWACHMGALQDLSAWLLRKIGLRPRPFRSRLLGYAPLVLALYMFVWPTARRELVVPALERWWPAALEVVGPATPRPALHARLTTDNLWERLPRFAIAAPFLLVCGSVTVLFLGSRGLCRYGCPYGGVFAPADRFSVRRIVVDPTRCDGCGLCTAACTNDIRVHEETRAFGRIINPRCERTLDCVAVCPRDALSMGWTLPALGRRATTPRRRDRVDPTLAEEVGIAALFVASFLVLRGLYGVVPMLMAFSMALCASVIAWKSWRLILDRDCRLAGVALRAHGRLTRAGLAFALVGMIAGALLAQSGAVRAGAWLGAWAERAVETSREEVFGGEPRSPVVEVAARRALGRYRLALGWRRGGLALVDTPAVLVRTAWLRLVLEDPAGAASDLRRVLEISGPSDALCADLARALVLAGRREEAIAVLEASMEGQAGMAQVRELLTDLLLAEGRTEEAAAAQQQAIAADPSDAAALASLASIRVRQGRSLEGVPLLRRAAGAAPGNAWIRHDLGVVLFLTGDVDGAVRSLAQAAALEPALAPTMLQRSGEMLASVGRVDEAESCFARARGSARGDAADPAKGGVPPDASPRR